MDRQRLPADDGSVDEAGLRARARECWERSGGEPMLGGRLFAPGPGRRPLLVIVGAANPWATGGAAALARGWSWLSCDRPLSEIADAPIDASRLFVLGPRWRIERALLSEHRFAAAVVEPTHRPVLPPLAREAWLAGDRSAFERELHLTELFDPARAEALRQVYDRPYSPIRTRWRRPPARGVRGRLPVTARQRLRRSRRSGA